MSFLLDTDTCSAYLKNDLNVVRRVMLHYGGLHLSVITVGELLTWALRANAPPARLIGVLDLFKGAIVLDVTLLIANKFGEIRAGLFDSAITVGEMDLLNGSTALVHGLTMVTHNTNGLRRHPRPDACRLAPSVARPGEACARWFALHPTRLLEHGPDHAGLHVRRADARMHLLHDDLRRWFTTMPRAED